MGVRARKMLDAEYTRKQGLERWRNLLAQLVETRLDHRS